MARRSFVLIGSVLMVVACGGVPEPDVITTPATQVSSSSTTTSGPGLATTTTGIATTSTGVVSSDLTTTVVVTSSPEPTVATTEPVPTSVATTTLPPLDRLRYQEVASLPYPIHAEPVPGTELMAIASKEGTVWLWSEAGIDPVPLLDVSDRVRNRGEQGLLGLAFAPDYPESRRLFVHYTAHNGDTVLAEFVGESGRASPTGETVLWRTPQPAPNHNGGTVLFGPDGYLYLGLGDGGGANDRYGHGQNDRSPLGALLRFDVSAPGVATPADGNPFPAAEVWAIGLRNPWRFTIDGPTGMLVIADVGQDLFEEVSVAPFDAAGLNYGWPITEGLHCFDPPAGCDASGLTLPVLEVSHADYGTCSITGGVVYRGSDIPELAGHYLFSDYCGGYLRSFPVEGPYGEQYDWTDQVGNAGQVVAFGTDHAGEVYVLTAAGSVLRLEAERSIGRLLRLVPDGA